MISLTPSPLTSPLVCAGLALCGRLLWWHSRLSALLILAMAVIGCSSSPSAAIPEGETVVYEGLPHPGYESELFESEKSKPTANLQGSYFYRQTQTLAADEAEALQAVLTDTAGFEPFGGEKKCGGFHADYAVASKTKGQVLEVLICFGCGEVKRYGPQGEVREDMKQETSNKLKELLKAYDKLRPAHEGWGP